MDIDEIKLFLRVDNDEEDDLIDGLQLAAEEYMTGAGVNKDYSKELYKLAVKLLVAHWYENRMVEVETGKTLAKISFSLNTIINQLKYTQIEVI